MTRRDKGNRDPMVVPKKVFEELEQVRKVGKVNMMEWRRVQKIADGLELHELVVWIQDHLDDYYHGIMYGFKPEGSV